MRKSPYFIASDLKEILCSYLETAYRVSNQEIVRERAALLRELGVVSQEPYIETTPRFQQGKLLRDLDLPQLSNVLFEFVNTNRGMPVGQYPLYWHQEQALRAAWDETGRKPNDIIVASGTGSGKTEIFYLTILADILREAIGWEPAERTGARPFGRWYKNEWHHLRKNEKRPAAVRALILYPMNALVNDQMRRLRRNLTSDDAVSWQTNHLNSNMIYFGKYTSQTMLAGTPDTKPKRDEWDKYFGEVQSAWNNMSEDQKAWGNRPRPDGSEMLCRWDMQAAPPDILLTNYSMLEYMLVRPIEANIFNSTRAWLSQSKDHIFTLVLDEAHSYSGARGTEVAYLIRRLYERLEVNPQQVRCIATSASLGNSPEELTRVQSFASQLFDHPKEKFSIIQTKTVSSDGKQAKPTDQYLKSFLTFQNDLEIATTDEDEYRAVQRLTKELGSNSSTGNIVEDLFLSLRDHPMVTAIRDATARNATELTKLANTIWSDLGTQQERGVAN